MGTGDGQIRPGDLQLGGMHDGPTHIMSPEPVGAVGVLQGPETKIVFIGIGAGGDGVPDLLAAWVEV